MANVPTDIRALSEDRVLVVDWGEGQQANFPFTFLRAQCQCAHCVNEWTGEQILDVATIPADIAVANLELVGGYAIRIHWTDGHNSGLFTWERLLELSQVV